MKHWFVLLTRPKHEREVGDVLLRNDVTSFLPLIKELRQWTDRKKRIEVPLFPCYLFVNISLKDRFKVFKAPGAIRFLDSNQHPTSVLVQELDLIRRLVSGKVEVTDNNFEVGDKLVVTSGSLKGLTGTVVFIRGARRLFITIDSLKKNLLVDISSCQTERIHDRKELNLSNSVPALLNYRIYSFARESTVV